MPINPNIALAARPVEIADPMAMYGKIAAIQGAQQQNALAQYQLGAAQRQEAATNALSKAYQEAYDPQTGGIDRNRLRQSLATGGFGAQIPGVEKALGELDTQALTRQKTEAELFDTSMKQIRNMWGNVRTPEEAIAVHDATHRDPIINKRLRALGITEEMGRQQILQAAQDPQNFAQFIQRAQLGAEKFMELNKPQLSTKDTGSELIDRIFHPLTNQITEVGRTTRVMTPGEAARLPILQQQANIAQQQLGVSQGQLNVAQQRLKQEGQTVSIQQDANGNLIAVPTRLAPGATPVARPVTGEAGAPVKGKPSAFAEKAQAQRVQMGKDLDFAIKELGDITKDGGLIDQSTGSGAGRLADIGAGFFGRATPGAIAIGKIAPVADLALKMVPRFEGPQSDKDTASYKEAAGQLADPTLPTAIRKEAGRTVLRLMRERKNQFVTNDMAAEGTGTAPAAGGVAPPPGFKPD